MSSGYFFFFFLGGGGQHFEFQYLFFFIFFFFGGGGFRKNDILGGMKILWIFLGFIAKWTIFRVFLCILGSRYRMGYILYIFLGVAKISNIFWGA